MSNPNEAETRKELIDPALEKAQWDLNDQTQVKFEIPVDGVNAEPWHGVTDYALYRANGEVLGVVEAKRQTHDARLAETQAEYYAGEIEQRQSFRPFAFLSDGRHVYFVDQGAAAKREVSGFFSRDDLERLLYIRQHKTPLGDAAINTAITDRLYQAEAIRRVCEAFDHGKRKALLVMATGTGKTRTTMSLIDLCLRTNQARKVLFVADRDALVEQALHDGFESFLADEPCGRIYAGYVDLTKRLYAATLQTMSNIYERFTPAFFDLIVFDEVHRSIFNKFNEVIQYFDARMVGLTATPAQFIERDTFRAFDCNDNIPTYLYTYEQAIADKFLVNYSLYSAKTKFQRKGIKGADLSAEERDSLMEQGIDPDGLNYEGTDLEEKVSNRDTLRRQWEEIWDVCLKDESGQLPGKTIIFALSQQHALRLASVFEEMYPQFPDMARVITSQSEYRGLLIDKFKKEEMPRIAISVDMLDTGIDVPEVVNLVFMKPVHSQIKLMQMLGRGTRSHATCKYPHRLPDGHKSEFLVVDFWENDFNKVAEERAAQSVPVLVSIFNTRLKLLETYLKDPAGPEAQRAVADLRKQILQIPIDSFAVKRVYPEVQDAWTDAFWTYLRPAKLEFLRLKVGPLLRYAPGVDADNAYFTSKIERLKLQLRKGQNANATAESIADDVSRLPDFVFDDPQLQGAAKLGVSPAQLATAGPAALDALKDALAPQMRNRRAQPNTFVQLDLRDFIDMRGYIWLREGSERVYVQEYRERVEKRIKELVESHATIQAVQRGEAVSDAQLIELERALRSELTSSEVELTADNIRRAYGLKVGSLLAFLRYLLGLAGVPDYAEVVQRQFEQFIAQHLYNANQINFLRVVQNVLLQKRRLTRADLYEEPLTRFGDDAVERWFTEQDVNEMLALTERLAA